MITPKTPRHVAVGGVSLPTLAVSPSVAKPTIYMPSRVAARVFGGVPDMHGGQRADAGTSDRQLETPHAA